MTTLLDQAIAELRALPEAEQDWAAENIRLIMRERDRSSGYQLTAEQVEKVRRTQEGLRNGTVQLVPEEEMDEFWRRHGA